MKAFEYQALAATEDRHWWFRVLREEIAAVIRRHFGERRELCMLDAGCGTGGLLKYLQEHTGIGNAVGLDFSPLALALAREKAPEAMFVHGDVTRLPFRSGIYDLVTSIDVLYAREAFAGFDAALRSIHACLRPGGLFVMQLPAYEWMRGQHDENVHTAHRFVRPEVREALTNAGFVQLRICYRYSLLLPAAAIMRKLGHSEADGSEVRTPVGWVDRLLYGVASAERLLGRWRLPFGLSVFAVAVKPGGNYDG